jgi:hypothetical protein
MVVAPFGSVHGCPIPQRLRAIEAIGWRLEHVGHVFVVTSESSRDKFLRTGQQTAVSGDTIGIYLVRNVD